MVRAYVIGVGMTKFEKPGKRADDYDILAKEAITKALDDSGIKFNEIEAAACGFILADSTSGQKCVYQLGMSGMPVFNVNNNCAAGSTALLLAKDFVELGKHECVLAFGFEKMNTSLVNAIFPERTSPIGDHLRLIDEIKGLDPKAPLIPQMFSNAGLEHMEKYGTRPEHFTKIAYKNHKHSVNNPYSQFQKEYSLEQIQKSGTVTSFLTRLQCCPTSDGSAAVIVASEKFVRSHGLEKKAVEILAMEMATDPASSLSERSLIKAAGFDMTKLAADKVFAKARLRPTDVQVVELHDCFSSSELITYEALGLCPLGKAGEFIDRGDNTYGGKYVVNPSGGLMSKGHPLGATGVAQCVELCWQLRGEAQRRQVKGAKVALQHNLGLGGAVVVALYQLGFPSGSRSHL